MINPKELRIGNLISFKDGFGTVYSRQISSIDFDKVAISNYSEYIDEEGVKTVRSYMGINGVNPIPITPEWLEKLGFKKKTELTYYKQINENKTFSIVYSVNGKSYTFPYYHSINTLVSFKYIHQLQNLYFSLIGKELEIN